MDNKMFTLAEMENMLEIGRCAQFALEQDAVKIEDSKELFIEALDWAAEFEKEYPETEDYYADIDVFAMKKLVERFSVED